MISRYSVRAKAKQIAQDAGPGDSATGVQLLLTDPDDYNTAILQALKIFSVDRPNRRIVDAVAIDGWRQPLVDYIAPGQPGPFFIITSGLLGTQATELDQWLVNISQMLAVWFDYDSTVQGQNPAADDEWRIVQDPVGTFLEFLQVSATAGQILRLEFANPHQLTEAENEVTGPDTAPTVALANPAAPGNVNTGSHTWSYYYETEQGRTILSPESDPLVIADSAVNGQVDVTVPASAEPGIIRTVVARSKIVGGSGLQWIVGSMATNGGIFRDNLTDASLVEIAVATDDTAAGLNTVNDRDEDTLAMLVASIILQIAAVKAVQNTGNTGLPNDIVDRRTQSDMYRSRSKELRDMYATMLGYGPAGTVKPASAVKDMDVATTHGWGFIQRGHRNQ